MNRRKALLILAYSIIIPVVSCNVDNKSVDTPFGQSSVKFNDLPSSIRYILDDIGIDELKKLKNISISDGPFGMIEVNGYLIDRHDWDLFLKENLS